MRQAHVNAYARQADREDGYYHSVASLGEIEPAVSGRANRHWRGPMIVNGLKLTWNQYQVYRYWKKHPGERHQMRKMADSLGIAPSTVSRAFTRLTILQLAWVDTKRGRWGGARFIIPPKGEWRERARKALARLKLAKQRNWERYSRRLDYWLGYWRDKGMPEYAKAAYTIFGLRV